MSPPTVAGRMCVPLWSRPSHPLVIPRWPPLLSSSRGRYPRDVSPPPLPQQVFADQMAADSKPKEKTPAMNKSPEVVKLISKYQGLKL